MSLNKVNYVNGTTVIMAENLNAIQDEIIANGNAIGTQAGEVSDLKSAVSELEAGSLSALDAELAEVPFAKGNGGWSWHTLGLKSRPLSPIYIGDYLCTSDFLPSCCIKIDDTFYSFDAHMSEWLLENHTENGRIRVFDIENNVEDTQGTIVAPLGHANSVAFDPISNVVYVVPVNYYASGTAVGAKTLYKFNPDSMAYLGEETDLPSVPVAVTYDPVQEKLYYLDENWNLYLHDRVEQTWTLLTKLQLPYANIALDRTYNQDLAIYDDHWYKSASVGDIIYGDITPEKSYPYGTFTYSGVDSYNKFKLGELEGMEFDSNGHLYAVCFIDLTSVVRNAFIVEIPVGLAITESSGIEMLKSAGVYTLDFSEANQSAFSLTYKQIRSLAQLVARTYRENVDRVLIPEGSMVVDDFRVEINDAFQLVVNGEYQTQGIDVYSGPFAISTDISHAADSGLHLLFTGTETPIRVRRVGELRFLGDQTLYCQWTHKPGWALNLIDVSNTSSHLTIRNRPADRLTDTTCYMGNAPLRNHSFTQGGGIMYMEPATVENSYIPNAFISQEQYITGFSSYMCTAFLAATYINVTTSSGLPAGSRVYFARCGRYPKRKIVANVHGVNGTDAQIVVDIDRYVYLYSPSGTQAADTFATTVFMVTDATNVLYNTDYLDGIPMLLDKAAYDNRTGTILGGTVENDDYAILGPFDVGEVATATYTIKTVPAVSESLQAFLRVYDSLDAASTANYGLSTAGDSRTKSITARYLTATVKKSEVENFYIHDDTNNQYICKGSNVT